MELQLVSFEQAKALKELGFYVHSHSDRELYVTSNVATWEQAIEIPYSDSYEYITLQKTFPVDIIGQLLYDVRKNNYTYSTKFQTVYAPTLELAAKWLREEKNIHIEPLFQDFTVYVCHFCIGIDSRNYLRDNEDYEITFDSYEEALSAGINKAIEILKQ